MAAEDRFRAGPVAVALAIPAQKLRDLGQPSIGAEQVVHLSADTLNR
jgi:hypothetical protein